MKVLLFSEQEISDILRVLAALLHLGNISFKGVVVSKCLPPLIIPFT